ncbi:MAG: tetratricopeptide repeat protein [Nitrospirota bacterium]
MSEYKAIWIFLLLLTGCGTVSSTLKQDCILQNNIGADYIKSSLWHDAKLHLLKALELAPQKASIYNNLGIVYEYFNKNEEATQAYQKAIELDFQTPVYQKNLKSFEKEYIGTITTFKQDSGFKVQGSGLKIQDSKKTSSKISTSKITIKRMSEPKIKIDKINRVAVFTFPKDQQDKNTLEMSKMMLELFKINMGEESPFYILEDYEIKELLEDESITQKDLEKSSKLVTLNKILSTEGLFIIKINKFNDNRHKDFELKNYYSTEKKEFVYYQQPYIKRNVQISVSISLFEGLTGNILWDKEYEDTMSTTYLGDNEEAIPLFDKQLFQDFMNKPVEDFATETSPQEKLYERIVVMEK